MSKKGRPSRAVELQKLFNPGTTTKTGPIPASLVTVPKITSPPPAPVKVTITPEQERQQAVDLAVQQAVIDSHKLDDEKYIQSYQVPISQLPKPDFGVIFGSPINIRTICIMLLDEDSVIARVKAGQFPITTYAICRDTAQMALRLWPNEVRAALVEYNKTRK